MKKLFKMVNGVNLELTAQEYEQYARDQETASIALFEEAKRIKTAQCQSYLESTDWQVDAFTKYGRPIDSDVPEKCRKAIQWKKDIKSCATLEELNSIIIDL